MLFDGQLMAAASSAPSQTAQHLPSQLSICNFTPWELGKPKVSCMKSVSGWTPLPQLHIERQPFQPSSWPQKRLLEVGTAAKGHFAKGPGAGPPPRSHCHGQEPATAASPTSHQGCSRYLGPALTISMSPALVFQHPYGEKKFPLIPNQNFPARSVCPLPLSPAP